MTHLAFELRTNTPGALTAELAERAETRGYRSLWVNHPPDEDGLGHLAKMAAATMRITLGTAVVPIGAVPPDAILRLPRLLEPWRDTVDAVVLVPISAAEPGPARDLVDAAIAAF